MSHGGGPGGDPAGVGSGGSNGGNGGSGGVQGGRSAGRGGPSASEVAGNGGDRGRAELGRDIARGFATSQPAGKGPTGNSLGTGRNIPESMFRSKPTGIPVSHDFVTSKDAGWLADVFGIDRVQTTRTSDLTGALGQSSITGISGSFSPLGFFAGLVGGIPAALAVKGFQALTGVKDPTAISFNTADFGTPSDKPNNATAERDGNGGDTKRKQIAKAVAADPVALNPSDLGNLVASVRDRQFDPFAFPQFNQLDNNFGQDFVFSPTTTKV